MAYPPDGPQEHGGNRRQILERFGHERVLDFSASINPLGHPPGLRERLLERWDDVLHYPEADASELRASLAASHGLPAECVLPGNGSAELLDLFVRAHAPRRLVLNPPDFGLYRRVAPAGLGLLDVPRRELLGFAPDFEELRRSVRSGDLVLLSQPCNPSGFAAARAELLALLRRCTEVGAVLAVDEAFCDFCPEESLLGAASEEAGLVVFRSLTKIYGIPGLRLGFAAGRPNLLSAAARLQVPWSVNALAQAAGHYCVSDAGWLGRTLEVVARERESLGAELDRIPGFRVFPSRANYLLVALSPPAPTASELYEALARAGILIRHCGSFGLGERFIRVAVRNREENARLVGAVRALAEPGGGGVP